MLLIVLRVRLGSRRDGFAVCFFFFSSRRRHTRLQGDWSSDVCSSDLRRAASWFARGPRILAPCPRGRTFHAASVAALPSRTTAMMYHEMNIRFRLGERGGEEGGALVMSCPLFWKRRGRDDEVLLHATRRPQCLIPVDRLRQVIQ